MWQRCCTSMLYGGGGSLSFAVTAVSDAGTLAKVGQVAHTTVGVCLDGAGGFTEGRRSLCHSTTDLHRCHAIRRCEAEPSRVYPTRQATCFSPSPAGATQDADQAPCMRRPQPYRRVP